MDKLKLSANAFQKLLDIKFRCIIGRKGKLREFILAFDTYDFHHLAGLHKLSDIPAIRKNRERVFKNILSDNITYDMINKSKDFSLIKSRLEYLDRLEEFMDSNSIIFTYDKRNNNLSNIDATQILMLHIYYKTN